jgi:hypothetical protein
MEPTAHPIKKSDGMHAKRSTLMANQCVLLFSENDEGVDYGVEGLWQCRLCVSWARSLCRRDAMPFVRLGSATDPPQERSQAPEK